MKRLSHIFGRRFRLARFEPTGLEFDKLAELILREPVAATDTHSDVVALPRSPLTAGELRQSIERHLQAKSGPAAPAETASPADELKNALAELRRSLR